MDSLHEKQMLIGERPVYIFNICEEIKNAVRLKKDTYDISTFCLNVQLIFICCPKNKRVDRVLQYHLEKIIRNIVKILEIESVYLEQHFGVVCEIEFGETKCMKDLLDMLVNVSHYFIYRYDLTGSQREAFQMFIEWVGKNVKTGDDIYHEKDKEVFTESYKRRGNNGRP